MSSEFWVGKKIFLTGHTGFKGGWISLWLHSLGAELFGFSLEPPTTPNFFSVANLESIFVKSSIADIRDANALNKSMQQANPDIVIHMAAQPLVRKSYLDPIETYSTNIIGTINLFEAVRKSSSVRAVVNITSDKCYENREWIWPYREDESMGGYDPYSSSKGCSELISSAYRRSFFQDAKIGLATARAGNVIGGGDWAKDRLIPDFFRSLESGDTLIIRSPNAIRPWQHVLEPIAGYLMLAEKLFINGTDFSQGWNFGPSYDDARTVEWIIKYLSDSNPNFSWNLDKNPQVHEANCLRLDSSKANIYLNWIPKWNLSIALNKILEWNSIYREGGDMLNYSLSQILAYQQTTV